MANNLSGFVKSIRDTMRNDAGINGDAQRIEQIAWMLFLKVYDAQEQNWEMDEDDFESIIPDDCKWSNWAQDDNLTGEDFSTSITLLISASIAASFFACTFKRSSHCFKLEGFASTANFCGIKKFLA